MSRKLLLLLSALVLLSLVTYVYYRRTLAAQPVDPYALVPDDAVLVISTHDHPTLVRHLQETQLWDNLTAVRYFQEAAGHLALADSLTRSTTRQRGLLQLLGRKLVITSVHVTGAATFDVLYQVPLTRVSEYRQVRALLETLGRDARYRLSTREYEGQEFTLLTERRSEASLTVWNYRNHLLVSASPALVEAAVRRLAHPEAPTVLAAFANTDLLKIKDLDATLLVSYRRLPKFLDVLFQADTHQQVDLLAGIASEGLLGLTLRGSRAELQGFSNPEMAKGALHQLLKGQPAQPLALASILSTRTALLLHLAAAPARTWPLTRTATDSASMVARTALDSLRASFGEDMGVAYLAAASAGSRPGRLAFVRCPRPARTAEWLAQLRRLNGNSPAFTKVGPYQMHATGFAEAAVLGPLLSAPGPADRAGASASTLVGEYLVLGDAVTLAGYLADVVAGSTWSQTPAQVAFLQKMLPRTRLGIFVDTRNSWNALLGALTEDRRAGLLRNETLFKRFPQLAWQLAPAENEAAPDAQYFTQVVLHHPNQATGQVPGGEATAGRILTFKEAMVGMPLLLSAPGTRVPAVVVQDSARVLHFVSADNAVLWADTLEGRAVGLRQLPTGLVLGAGNRLHQLGNDGREATPFPFNLPDTMRVTNLVAAVGSSGQPARLLAVTAGHGLLLLDAQGRQYPGWQPKRLDFPLAGAPVLLSVNGRDVVVAALQNGYVYAYDQQGSLYPGFPLSVGARLAGGLAVQAGATLARTRLTVINQHGELVTFSLSGDVLSRRRVATWSRTATFRLVPDQRAATFVLTRDDAGRLDVYAGEGPAAGPLLSRTFVTSGPKPVQLFDFGGGHRVLAVTEPGPGQVYLYDGHGLPLGGEPLASSGTGVGLSYDANSGVYQLVRLVSQELRRTEFQAGR
jgi:hypothetical protein